MIQSEKVSFFGPLYPEREKDKKSIALVFIEAEKFCDHFFSTTSKTIVYLFTSLLNNAI